MVSEQLQNKIDRAIHLLQAYNLKSKPVEVAYSGGKDSDVILQLAKEAGIQTIRPFSNTKMSMRSSIGSFSTILRKNGMLLKEAAWPHLTANNISKPISA